MLTLVSNAIYPESFKTFLPIDKGVKVLLLGGGFSLLPKYTNGSYRLDL